MPSLSTTIIGLLILGNFVTYGTMVVREKIVIAGAVRAERNAGIAACNVRVGEIERQHNDAVRKAASDALAAEATIGDTPAGAELVRLCKASASCRSRGSL